MKVERYGFCRIYCFREASHLIEYGWSSLLESTTIDQVLRKSAEDFEYLDYFYPRYYETLRLLFHIGCKSDDWGS